MGRHGAGNGEDGEDGQGSVNFAEMDSRDAIDVLVDEALIEAAIPKVMPLYEQAKAGR